MQGGFLTNEPPGNSPECECLVLFSIVLVWLFTYCVSLDLPFPPLFTHFSRWLKPVFLIYFKPVFLMAENRSSEPGGDADVDIGAVAGGRGWQP